MRNMLTIWRREFMAVFFSPVAYVTMVVFLSMTGWTFLEALDRHDGARDPLTVLFFLSIFFWIPILVTVVTMRLFSEERSSGTIEMLMTAPVSDSSVVMGKYAGALTFVLLVISTCAIHLLVILRLSAGVASVDRGALAGGALMIVLISALCTAIGMCISMLTRNQIIAAICCFSAVCIPFFIHSLLSSLPIVRDSLVQYMALETHIIDFSKGYVSLQAVVLYLSATIFSLFAAIRLLESRRWFIG